MKDHFLYRIMRFLFWLLIMGTVIGWAADPPVKVVATVNRTTLPVNEQLVFTVELTGSKAGSVGEPQLPDMGGYFTFLGSGGTSRNIQIVNGRMTSALSYTYFYMATKEGDFTIPPAKVIYQNAEYASDPIKVTIAKSAAPSAGTTPPRSTVPAADIDDANLFLRVIVDKKRIYQNEPVSVTFRIYTRVNVSSYGLNKAPETTGFWAEEIEQQGGPATREEVVNGQKYVIADLKKMVLFPTSPGNKTIGPMAINCDVRVQNRRRSTDIFSNFFNDPFFSRTVRKTIYSRPFEVDVIPFPEQGKPANFSGVTGDFDLKVTVDKDKVKTNEAISLKIRYSGEGNIKTLPRPIILIPPDFEQYEPKVSENISREGNRVRGSKTFEYVLVPRFPGQQRIRPVEFSFFDPHSNNYRTVRSQEIIINVAKGEGDYAMATSGFSKEEVRLLGQDIRYIELSIPEFSEIGHQFYKNNLFIILAVFPFILLIAAVGYKNHLDKLSDNVAYARSRRANKMAMKRLSLAHKLLSEKTQKDFYAEISRALLGFAADKLNLEQAGIISADLEKRLAEKGVSGDIAGEYMHLIAQCNFQRFAPAAVTKENMQNFYQKGKVAIVKLEKAF